VIECPVLYKHVFIVIAEHEFPGDLIRFDMSEFEIALGMDWLTIYGANIDFRVTLKDLEGRNVCFYGERLRKDCSIISIMKAGKMVR